MGQYYGVEGYGITLENLKINYSKLEKIAPNLEEYLSKMDNYICFIDECEDDYIMFVNSVPWNNPYPSEVKDEETANKYLWKILSPISNCLEQEFYSNCYEIDDSYYA